MKLLHFTSNISHFTVIPHSSFKKLNAKHFLKMKIVNCELKIGVTGGND